MEERIMVKLARLSNAGCSIYQLSDAEYNELKGAMLFHGSIIDENRTDEGYIGTVFGTELYHHIK